MFLPKYRRPTTTRKTFAVRSTMVRKPQSPNRPSRLAVMNRTSKIPLSRKIRADSGLLVPRHPKRPHDSRRKQTIPSSPSPRRPPPPFPASGRIVRSVPVSLRTEKHAKKRHSAFRRYPKTEPGQGIRTSGYRHGNRNDNVGVPPENRIGRHAYVLFRKKRLSPTSVSAAMPSNNKPRLPPKREPGHSGCAASAANHNGKVEKRFQKRR